MAESLITAKDIMIEPITASPATPIIKIAKMLASAKREEVIIINKGGKIAGIITVKDLVYKMLAEGAMPKRATAESVMSSPVVAVGVNTDVTEMAELMKKNRISRLPVVSRDGKLVGVVTAHEIVKVSPDLYNIMLANSLRETSQPTHRLRGTCEVCGTDNVDVVEMDGVWVCESCREIQLGR